MLVQRFHQLLDEPSVVGSDFHENSRRQSWPDLLRQPSPYLLENRYRVATSNLDDPKTDSSLSVEPRQPTKISYAILDY